MNTVYAYILSNTMKKHLLLATFLTIANGKKIAYFLLCCVNVNI